MIKKTLFKYLHRENSKIELGVYDSFNAGVIIKKGIPLDENKKMTDAVYVKNNFDLKREYKKVFVEKFQYNEALSESNFCSIACGLGGEEYLFASHVKKLTLIEPCKRSCDFLRNKFHKFTNTIIFEGIHQDYTTDHYFDYIYTNGPSDWLSLDPFKGIHSDYINFIHNNLKHDGIFMACLYGGGIIPFIRSKAYYVELIKSAEKKSLFITAYFDENTLYIIISKEKKEGLMKWLEDVPNLSLRQCISNNEIKYYKKLSVFEKMVSLVGLTISLIFSFIKGRNYKRECAYSLKLIFN